MAINIQIFSNANSSSRSISFDFVGDILAPTDVPTNVACQSFYFKATAGGTQDNSAAFPVKIIRSLDELVLNKNNQSALNSGTTNAYSSIKELFVDYTYDYINGHAANAYGSECTIQFPMKFR